ncbi:MAG TPA: lysylphosphatidylglycerol synthase transmembrane domain-containing protein [Solirubrobacterales bacterium]|nr:lysylphosphatidylglycerol synthase transmembrane domain-containing protein [Solirubrobacterales bacterium]
MELDCEMNDGTATGRDARTLELERLQSRRRLVELGVFVALLTGAIVALPGLGDLRERLAAADLSLVVLAAALELGSCLAFVAAFRGVFSRRLSWRFSYEVAMTEQAANVLLPTGGAGGLALGAWALRRIGMPADRIGRRTVAFFLITSSVNFAAVILAGLALALGLLPGEVAIPLALIPAALAITAICVVALLPRLLEDRSASGEGRLHRLLAAGGAYLAGGIRDAGRLLGSGRAAIVGGAVGYMALDVLALGAMFAALGGDAPSLGVFVLAYALGQLGGLIPLPGGIGGTDGGLVAAFALLGTPIAVSTAAVLAYRLFQLGVPAILGLAAFTQLRRRLAGEDTAVAASLPRAALEPRTA